MSQSNQHSELEKLKASRTYGISRVQQIQKDKKMEQERERAQYTEEQDDQLDDFVVGGDDQQYAKLKKTQKIRTNREDYDDEARADQQRNKGQIFQSLAQMKQNEKLVDQNKMAAEDLDTKDILEQLLNEAAQSGPEQNQQQPQNSQQNIDKLYQQYGAPAQLELQSQIRNQGPQDEFEEQYLQDLPQESQVFGNIASDSKNQKSNKAVNELDFVKKQQTQELAVSSQQQNQQNDQNNQSSVKMMIQQMSVQERKEKEGQADLMNMSLEEFLTFAEQQKNKKQQVLQKAKTIAALKQKQELAFIPPSNNKRQQSIVTTNQATISNYSSKSVNDPSISYSGFYSFKLQQEQKFLQDHVANQEKAQIKKTSEEEDMLFYWYDAVEDQKKSSVVYMYGKVLTVKGPQNACLRVEKQQRDIYFVKRDTGDYTDQQFQEEVEQKIKFYYSAVFQAMSTQLEQKHYCFEMNVARGQVTVLRVSYPFDYPPLNKIKQSGDTYRGIFGNSYSALELLLIKRRVMGPCWLRVQNFKEEENLNKKSHCKHEFVIDDMEDFREYKQDHKSSSQQLQTPKMKAMAMQMKTVKVKSSKSTIQAIATITIPDLDVEISKYDQKFDLKCYALNLDNNASVTKNLQEIFGENIKVETTEEGLINAFISNLIEEDPDVLIGHDIMSTFLDNFIQRMHESKITKQSFLGKYRRTQNEMSNSFKNSKGNRIRAFTYGRLVLDTFLGSKELVRESDYTLDFLSSKYIRSQDILSEEVLQQASMNVVQTQSQQLGQTIDDCIKEAYYSLQLNNKLQIIQLSKQLTNVAGCLWIKSLQNARAERNEMLLMHMFYKRDFILPDKPQKQYDAVADQQAEDGNNDKKGKKKDKKYKGGLVIAPKSDIYSDYVLLVDFNSLYPSIIREYKICFTTVLDKREFQEVDEHQEDAVKNELEQNKDQQKEDQKKENQEDENIPVHYPQSIQAGKHMSILPVIIDLLIRKRKEVKKQLKDCTNIAQAETLDIKQKAYKLIANSIYGCLGFKFSRFYAQALAAMVTSYGRIILQQSADMVQNLDYDVIYGDTDSLMINSRTKNIFEAIQVGMNIKKEINGQYKNKILEIELDGVFKSLLLYKKKKYAAIKVDNFADIMTTNKAQFEEKIKDGFKEQLSQEIKGLDLVRRDWCGLCKKIGKDILDMILQIDGDKDQVIQDIYEYFRNVSKNFRLIKKTPLSNFVIYKQLNKEPNLYQNNTQPHAEVAKRTIKEKGLKPDQLNHHYIQYVICRKDDQQADPKLKEEAISFNRRGQAERAFSPEQFNQDSSLHIDYDWYANNQIVNPIERLLKNLEGIDLSLIVSSLGISEKRFANQDSGQGNQGFNDQNSAKRWINQFGGDVKLFNDIKWQCPRCESNCFNDRILFTCANKSCNFELKEAQISNLVKRNMNQMMKRYYSNYSKGTSEEPGQTEMSMVYLAKSEDLDQQGRKVEFQSKDLYSNMDKYSFQLNSFCNKQVKEKRPITAQSVLDYVKKVQSNSQFEMFNFTKIFSNIKDLRATPRHYHLLVQENELNQY